MDSSIEKIVQKLWGEVRGFRKYFSSDHCGAATAFWFILGFVKGSSLEKPEKKGYLLRHLAAIPHRVTVWELRKVQDGVEIHWKMRD